MQTACLYFQFKWVSNAVWIWEVKEEWFILFHPSILTIVIDSGGKPDELLHLMTEI